MAVKVKILLVEQVTHSVKRFIVEKPSGYRFIPGQATNVSVNQAGLQTKKRPFTFTSLASDLVLEFIIKGYPTDDYPGHSGVTEVIHRLSAGDELIIDEPWGTINYGEPGVFIAGGAGITPFLAIFKDLEQREEIGKNRLIFSNKTQKDIIMEGMLRSLFNRPNQLLLTLTQEKRDGYECGRVDKRFLEENLKVFNQPFYLCGSKQMVKDLRTNLVALGANPKLLVFEK